MALRTLPPDEDQAAIGQVLSSLSEAIGPQWLLDAPILLPRPEDFPDEWRPDVHGAEALLERLLELAGLGEHPFTIVSFRRERPPTLGAWHRTHDAGTAAWFAGKDDSGRLVFGLDLEQLRDAESLVGVWAHEVAHAFRHVHRLRQADAELEEELTDLTTVALGFGVLTTNNALRLRRTSELRGAGVLTTRSTQRYGYLPYQMMAFALGLQVRLRMIWGGDVSVAAIRRSLETAQQETFDATLTLDEVAARALVPIRGRDRWPTVVLPTAPPPQRLPPVEEPSEPAPSPTLEPTTCPACGFTGTLTGGACADCGLQLDELGA